MDAKTLEAAVTPFFTTKGVGKGTGLGLPMVQGLMAQSGGKLVLRSEKGRGTTAELWLPEAVEGNVSIPDTNIETPDLKVRPMTVLAVDDDPLVLMNTVKMLEDMGHKVIEAQSGDEALSIIQGREHIDFVVTDHSMPKMTGAQLAKELFDVRPDVRLVLATGYAELPADAGVGLLRLTKPFTQSQLSAVIFKAVNEGLKD